MGVVKRRTVPKVKNIENDCENIVEKENVENKEDELKRYDFNSFQPSEAKQSQNCLRKEGVISIVSNKSCKRVSISKKLLEELRNPKEVVISYSNDKIVIGTTLPNNSNYFNVKYVRNKGMIYSSELVKEIEAIYGLDFSNRTSITFSEVEYAKYEVYKVAIITMKKEGEN
ncbi:TPA: hypothetical protein I9061_002535 [Clostridium perfringens]|nr:hypothetical protein [Clostridium perfringens]